MYQSKPALILAAASAFALVRASNNNNNNATFDLEERQTPCFLSDHPVTACGPGDFTKANWDAFEIDGFLANIINAIGTADNFPKFFVSQETPPENPYENFDCYFDPPNLPVPPCGLPKVNNPRATTDCAFTKFNLQDTFCANFVDPKAGFVVQNYINLWQGLQNHHDAIQDAGDAIAASNFINIMVEALAPKKQPIGPAVFSLIADLVTDILPIGGQIKAAATFMKKIRLVIKATKSDLKDDSNDIVSVIQQNEQIDKEVTATEEQLTLQLRSVVTGTGKRLQNILSQTFGPNKDAQVLTGGTQIGNSFAFLNPYHGVFLDDVPQRGDLANQMRIQLQNWIVSSVLTTMGYDVTIDKTPLFDDPADPGGVCRAQGGFDIGGGCALFRINGITTNVDDASQGNNIFALQTTAGLNIRNMILNALACTQSGGKAADFESFLTMENTADLPTCMFNFKVASIGG